MAVPQRWHRSTLPTEPATPERKRASERRRVRKRQSKDAGRRRRFALLVVIPVLLMLGSVYLHTVSSGLEARTASLEEDLDRTRAEGERLEVEVAKLSAADRIRPLAREKFGMRDAGSQDLQVHAGTQREDGKDHGGEKKGGEPRPR